jgi:prepilin-type N-terminal cleavage/methylation domain-containing protein
MTESDDSGFTVFELLITLSIFGLAAAGLLGTLTIAQRTLLAINNTDDAVAEIAQVRAVLLDALRRLSVHGIWGDGRTLKLTGPPPRSLGLDGSIVLTLSPAEDGEGLIGAWQRPSGPQDTRHRLVAPERHVLFGYQAVGGSWTDQWTAQSQWPTLVRATIVTAASRVPRAVLAISPQVLVPAICAIRPSDKTCRDES